MDQVSIQSVFTEEAKAEAMKFIYSKLSHCGVSGKAIKECANVSYHGLYGLTRANYL